MRFISTTSYCSLDARPSLTQEEWDELVVLKNAISYLPSTVHPAKMQRFSQLFAKSLLGKGDPIIEQ